MMFIIANESPEDAITYLVTHTNKRFYFKQLIELGQLICSAGFSNEYKKVYRGKEIQNWIRKYPSYTYWYYKYLLEHCDNEGIFKSLDAKQKCYKIKEDLLLNDVTGKETKILPETAIFRYKKEYQSQYPTNSELPIEIACNEYINYIENYKFKKEDK